MQPRHTSLATWSARRRGALAALVILATLSACGGSGSGDAVVDPGAISISLANSSGSIAPAGTATVAVTVARTGSFSGPVDLSVEGLPAGVTAAFSPAQIAAGATTSTATLTATSAAVAGPSTLTVRAKGTGVTDRTAAYALTVQAPTASGAFTLALSPATLSVAAGASGTSTITIARTGAFTGAVNLAVSGAPTGVTATLSSASVTGTSATLTVTAAAGTAASTGTITVTGSGTGASNATAALALTTTAVSGSTGSITHRFCDAVNPTWFAVQDGTGAWTRVTGSSNTYSFDISSATGGVAYATPTAAGAGYSTNVYYGNKAELTAHGVFSCPTVVGKTITGTTAGLTSLDNAYVSLGNRITSVFPVAGTGFTLTGVVDGAHDLVATRNALTLNGLAVSSTLGKIIVRRALNPAAGAVLPVLDFNAAEAVAPATATATINNLGTDQSLFTVLLQTANGTNGLLYSDPGAGGASRTFFGLPAAQQIAGDLHYVQATALGANFTSDPIAAATGRSAGTFISTVSNVTLTLGSALSTPTITTVASTPYARLRAVLPRQAEYNQTFSASYQQSGSTPRNVLIEATAAYVGAGSFDVTIPDFSSIGYDGSWGLRSGVSTMWVLTATGFSAGTNAVVQQAVGVTALVANKAGQITP